MTSQGNSLSTAIFDFTEYWGNVLPILTDNCCWCLRNQFVNACCWIFKTRQKLFIFSMESLWYSSTEWFFKSSLVSFQLWYDWVMRIIALNPWCADVLNETHARQNNPFVDFEYDKNLKLWNHSCKQYRLISTDFFRLPLYILGGNLNDFSGAHRLFLITALL